MIILILRDKYTKPMNILDKIIDHYKHPQNKGILSNWSYKSQSDNPISLGCADMMCERILGFNTNELKNLKFDLFDLEKSPISKSRYKCATLSLEAVNNIKKE